MQDSPLISVMILTYNHAEYVRQAVNGALMQKCSYPFEIVVCDDCSSDKTRDICLELQQKYPDKIRLIFNEKNKGLINNYLDTMRQCKGKYIADCAGDDYWIDSSKLQKQVDILEQQENIVLVYTNWKDLISRTGEILNDSKSRKNNFKTEFLTSKDLFVYLNQKGYSIVNINTTCFRKNEALMIFDEYHHLFDKDKYPCEDFQLLFLLLRQGVFYYIDEEMVVYRNNEDSAGRMSDFSKYFVYQYMFMNLRMELSREFGVALDIYFPKQAWLLVSLAFKAKNGNYAREAKDLVKYYGYSWGGMTELLYKITVNRILLSPVHRIFLLLRWVKLYIKGIK